MLYNIRSKYRPILRKDYLCKRRYHKIILYHVTQKFLSSWQKLHIFISYAHEDKEWVLEGPGNIHLIPRIRRHTSPDAEIWFDEGLVIGEKWDEEIHNHIVQSHIAILLISESFVSSDYIVNKELVWIKEQVEKNDMKIVPLLIGNITEKSETNNRLDISKANTPFRDTTALQLSQR